AIFLPQPLGFDRVLYQYEDALERNRFFRKVKGPKLGRAHSGLDCSVTGDHDRFRRVLEFPQPLERFQTVDPGKPDIKQNNVECTATQGSEACFTAICSRNLVTFVFQDAVKRFPDLRLVIDYENRIHRMGACASGSSFDLSSQHYAVVNYFINR